MTEKMKQVSPEHRDDSHVLQDILEKIHLGLAEELLEKVQSGDLTADERAACLRLLKQNNVMVVFEAKKTDHVDELGEARKKAEGETSGPFGRSRKA